MGDAMVYFGDGAAALWREAVPVATLHGDFLSFLSPAGVSPGGPGLDVRPGDEVLLRQPGRPDVLAVVEVVRPTFDRPGQACFVVRRLQGPSGPA